MQPIITVIIPVYKVENYLRKCVDSVLSQTYVNLEIFLVDDGSPDNCGTICDEYAVRESRIKVIHKENGGLSSARNAALEVMTGEYLLFVDSDDYITPDAIEGLYSSLIKNNADIATGNMISVDENGVQKNFYFPAETEKVLEGDSLLDTMLQPCAPNRLYKSGIFDGIRFPEGKLYEDVFIYHKILAKTNRMVLTGRTSYYYTVRSGSIMHSEYNIGFTDIVFAIRERYRWLDSIGKKELADESRLFVYSRVAVAYAHLDKKNPVHKAKLEEITGIYNECYKILIKRKNVSSKQKVRLFLLRYFPGIHTCLFGKNMPLSLG